MRRMKDVPERDRPREKIAKKGVTSLTDQELIESILGRGTRDKDVRVISKEICGLLKDHQGTIQYAYLHNGDRPVKGCPDHSVL